MTPQLQLFMVLGALVLLCIIFTLLKRGLMSVKYSLLWLLLAVALAYMLMTTVVKTFYQKKHHQLI